MALDTTKTFCSAITDIERYAALTLSATTIPTVTQGEEYAYDVSSVVTMQTEKAGSKLTPPHSSDATGLSRVLAQANAVGAAFLIRKHIYTLNGDPESERVAAGLAAQWESLMGSDAAKGGCLCAGSGGLVFDAVASASDSRLLVTPVSQGEVTLEELTTRTQAMTFTVLDRD